MMGRHVLILAAGYRQNRIAAALLGMALLAFMPGAARSQAPTQGNDPTYSSPSMGTTSNEGMAGMAGRYDPAGDQRRLMVNKAVQRQTVVNTTIQLLQSTQELDEEIRRTHPETLTLAELKKLAEIEKLAHKVKATLTEIGRGATSPQPRVIPIPVEMPKH